MNRALRFLVAATLVALSPGYPLYAEIARITGTPANGVSGPAVPLTGPAVPGAGAAFQPGANSSGGLMGRGQTGSRFNRRTDAGGLSDAAEQPATPPQPAVGDAQGQDSPDDAAPLSRQTSPTASGDKTTGDPSSRVSPRQSAATGKKVRVKVAALKKAFGSAEPDLKVFLVRQGAKPVATTLSALPQAMAAEGFAAEFNKGAGHVRYILGGRLAEADVAGVARSLKAAGLDTSNSRNVNMPESLHAPSKPAPAADGAAPARKFLTRETLARAGVAAGTAGLYLAVVGPHNLFAMGMLAALVSNADKIGKELVYTFQTLHSALKDSKRPTWNEVALGLLGKVGPAVINLAVYFTAYAGHRWALALLIPLTLAQETFHGVWADTWNNFQGKIGTQRGMGYQSLFNFTYGQVTTSVFRAIAFFALGNVAPPWSLAFWSAIGWMCVIGTFVGPLGYQSLNELYEKGRIARVGRSSVGQLRDLFGMTIGPFFSTGNMFMAWALFGTMQSVDVIIALINSRAATRPIVYVADEAVAASPEFDRSFVHRLTPFQSAVQMLKDNVLVRPLVAAYRRIRDWRPRRPGNGIGPDKGASGLAPPSGVAAKDAGQPLPVGWDQMPPEPKEAPKSVREASLEPAPGKSYTPSPEDWRQEVVYSVIIDRYASSGAPETWGDPADPRTRHGGTLRGLIEKLDYIRGSGATTLLVNPVFMSPPASYIDYWPVHFMAVDPRIGTMDDFKELVAQAHKRGMRVVLDMVFNHTGPVLEYKDGWRFSHDPKQVNKVLYPIKPEELQGLDNFHRRGSIDDWNNPEQTTWGDFPGGLNQLATERRQTQDILLTYAKWWIKETDIDGFRLDTYKHVASSYWTRFYVDLRAYAATLGKMNFLMLGEIYDGDPGVLRPELGNGRLDAAYNYPGYFAQIAALRGEAPTRQIEDSEKRLQAALGGDVHRLVRFLDNQDKERFLPPGAPAGLLATALAYALFSIGIPFVYYGTEQGFRQAPAAYGMDSYREDFFAEGKYKNPASKADNFDTKTAEYKLFQALAAVRAAHPALRTGEQYFRWSDPNGPGLLAFSRVQGDEEVLVVLNTSGQERSAEMFVDFVASRPGTTLHDELDPAYKVMTFPPSGGGSKVVVRVPPYGVRVLVRKARSHGP